MCTTEPCHASIQMVPRVLETRRHLLPCCMAHQPVLVRAWFVIRWMKHLISLIGPIWPESIMSLHPQDDLRHLSACLRWICASIKTFRFTVTGIQKFRWQVREACWIRLCLISINRHVTHVSRLVFAASSPLNQSTKSPTSPKASTGNVFNTPVPAEVNSDVLDFVFISVDQV